MPTNKERAMEYNLNAYNYLCRKLDVHPIALTRMITANKIWQDPAFTSFDDHEKAQRYIKQYLQEMESSHD